MTPPAGAAAKGSRHPASFGPGSRQRPSCQAPGPSAVSRVVRLAAGWQFTKGQWLQCSTGSGPHHTPPALHQRPHPRRPHTWLGVGGRHGGGGLGWPPPGAAAQLGRQRGLSQGALGPGPGAPGAHAAGQQAASGHAGVQQPSIRSVLYRDAAREPEGTAGCSEAAAGSFLAGVACSFQGPPCRPPTLRLLPLCPRLPSCYRPHAPTCPSPSAGPTRPPPRAPPRRVVEGDVMHALGQSSFLGSSMEARQAAPTAAPRRCSAVCSLRPNKQLVLSAR